ncbi:Signal transduction histidine kinase [Microbulbifer donghaiensis]|uniref:histidine kinase n=1 Tax=Microbulbifer donghaiensis TaxID=494016 RepID=A0A1M4XYT4_9GAMM|nr:HAMP domain-containing sensor histidine kinase [Microbulbifer donghaiensis]SHE98588.1 Signal transduction histidine kinase [Microbulbifer donghaiensis]
MTLRFRFVVFFCAFALLLGALFSAVNFLVAYTLEDRVFERELAREADYLTAHFQRHGQWPEPRRENYSLHLTTASLPALVRETLAAETKRTEFFGEEGRHYHLRRLAGRDAMLLAEVSADLLVRPRAKAMLVALGLLTLAMMVIGCALAYAFARGALAPLSRLTRQVELRAPGEIPGGFASRYPDNEIGVLARALDEAFGQVGEYVAREVQFTRDASHELRTPISAVGGAAELLADRCDLDPEARILVERIRHANRSMAQAVQTLLTLARDEGDQLQAERLSLLAAVEKVVVSQAGLLEGKEIAVKIDIDPGQTIEMPPSVLDILLTNLIANAFQYTAEGEVSITADASGLVIADTGGGIAPELQPLVTRPLVKGQASQGFGIGLSIVQRLCDRYRLKLAIDDGGQGCRVRVIWPGGAG